MEEKMRIIELADRKKHGFRSLFVNLLAHIMIFCIQAYVFSHMQIAATHPNVMMRVGVVLLQIVLLLGIGLKLLELFRWNKAQIKMKQEILQIREQTMQALSESRSYYVSVLFTRGRGLVSELIYWVSGRQYTHASI
jgi:hypothetical protein